MGRKAATKATPEKEVNELAMLVFLSAVSEGATIGEAALEAGVNRKTVYRWKESDAEFAEAWDESLEEGTELLEREAVRRAVHGVEEPVIYQGQLTPIYEHNPDGTLKMVETRERNAKGRMVTAYKPVQAVDAEGNPRFLTVRKPSDTLLIFMLKSRRPNTYRERGSIEHTGAGGKPLPTPVAGGGVLVVPGIIADAAAWSAAVRKAKPGDAA
jgi:hypothetical protein